MGAVNTELVRMEGRYGGGCKHRVGVNGGEILGHSTR